MPPSESSIQTVLDWYLRRLTADRYANRRAIVVPAEMAGWVLAGDTEDAAEADGSRPLGAVRDLLEELFLRARLDRQQSIALRATYGLSEYPAADTERPLRLRVPRQRARSTGKRREEEALAARRLRGIIEKAIALLDLTVAAGNLSRPASREARASPLPEPATAPWFCRRVSLAKRPSLIRTAIDHARLFVVVSGVEGETVGRVLEDLEGYKAAIDRAGCEPRRPLGRSRARALVGLCLWELTRLTSRSRRLAPPTTGLLYPPDRIQIADASVSAFVAGDRTDEVVLAACAAARSLAGHDRRGARVVADLLIGACIGDPARRLSDEATATIVQTVVRVRAGDEDPSAVALAWYAHSRWPNRWQTIDAIMAAVPAASAAGSFEVADELCDAVDRMLRRPFLIPSGRDLRIERVEYALWNAHQRSGTLRRRVETGERNGQIVLATRHNVAATRYLGQLLGPDLQRRGPGDATASWAFHLLVRRAELDLMAQDRESPDGVPRHMKAAVARARRVADENGIDGSARIPLIKLDLLVALGERDGPTAAEHLLQLHQLRWPLRRTIAPVAVLVDNPRDWQGAPPELVDAVLSVAAMQADPGWPAAVDDTNRVRRRHRVAAGLSRRSLRRIDAPLRW